MTDRTALQIVIPFHQHNWADASTIDAAVAECYAPLLESIARRAGARIAIGIHGHLLDHLARRHEPFLLRIRDLVEAGQVEVLGGLFYGGAPGLLSDLDVRGQVEMLSQFWESYLGSPPSGFWLPELAWSEVLPHQLADTELEYGFASASQLRADHEAHRGLGVLHVGCERIPVFVLDWELSRGLPSMSPEDWVEALLARRPPTDTRVTSVWVRAESLGLEPGTRAWCRDGGWIEAWLDLISGQRPEIEPLLPAEGFERARPAVSFALESGCAPELRIYGRSGGSTRWIDFPRHFIEVDTLHRRILRGSSKLLDAIATMEDEEIEDVWSDALATAQRHIFAAQGVEAFHRGASPGFSNPPVREAAYANVIAAGNLIDRLVQGDDDWIASEEEDVDGDLVDEVFVSTAHVEAWISLQGVDAACGLIRTLDNRRRGRTLLDVGARRTEPFFDVMARAPVRDESTRRAAPTARGEHLERLESALPTAVDGMVRRGITLRVYDEGVSAEEYDSGSAVDLLGESAVWEILSNYIDEEGDCSYLFKAQIAAPVAGLHPRTVHVTRSIEIPIDAPEILFHYEGYLEGGPPAVLATEIPLRLAASPVRLVVDGRPTDLMTKGLPEVSEVRLEGADGEVVSVHCEAPIDVLVVPIRTSIMDLDGYRSADQGVVLVPLLPIDEPTRGSVRVRFE